MTQQKSNTVPAILFGAALIALVVSLIVAFIPFSKDGTAATTSAFAAQQRLDEVALKFGSSPGAMYTGKITSVTASGKDSKTIEFKKLTVASTNNAEGEIMLNGTTAQFRQIGNYRYMNGPSKLWSDLFGDTQLTKLLDLKTTDNTWTDLTYSGIPSIGELLSPILLAGRIGNTERVKAPELGLQLGAPSKGLPDARYWPTSDPMITVVGNDKIRVGEMETTFDPDTKAVTHIKGQFTRANKSKVTIDTEVTPVGGDALAKLFANERSLAPELVSTPAPGVPFNPNLYKVERAGGDCTTAACDFKVMINGALHPQAAEDLRYLTGHVNVGVTVKFRVDDRPAGATGGTCQKVITVPIGGRGEAICTATNMPAGSRRVLSDSEWQFMPFVDIKPETLTEYIDNQEKSSKLPVTMIRTGHKRGDASVYNDRVTGLPSSYAVKEKDYVFDGVGPGGNLFVTFGPGYAEHITGADFDQSWEGTKVITDQLKQQVAAAGEREITYFVAEPETLLALRLLVLKEGIDPDKIRVLSIPLED